MAGRPRKPVQTKIIQGTFQKSRNPKDEARFSSLSKLPAAPKALIKYGKRLWDYGAELVSAGIITAPDVIAFEMCCEVYGRYKALQEYIDSDPINNVEGAQSGRSAQAQQMNADFSACVKMMNEFGLTPASRNRFGVTKKKDADPDTEKMKGLLGA